MSPDLPPPPARNKPNPWLVGALVGVVAAALALGAFALTTDPDRPETGDSGANGQTAESVVDRMLSSQPPGYLGEFCDSYDAIGNHDVALSEFEEGFKEEFSGSRPKAADVFEELVSRC